MVGVAKNDFRVGFQNLADGQAFDATDSSDRHERRCLNLTVRCCDFPESGATMFVDVQQLEFEFGRWHRAPFSRTFSGYIYICRLHLLYYMIETILRVALVPFLSAFRGFH